jgi:hypothetical protein
MLNYGIKNNVNLGRVTVRYEAESLPTPHNQKSKREKAMDFAPYALSVATLMETHRESILSAF